MTTGAKLQKGPLGIAIGVGNHKGGVGKTTNSVHIAAALGERGFNVLLLDLDPGANSTKHLGVNGRGYGGTFEFLVEEGDLDPREVAITQNMPKGVSLIPSREQLGELPNYIEMTYNVLAAPLAMARKHYDIIICDTAPNSKFLTTVSTYLEAEWFLLSAFADKFSLFGIKETLKDIETAQKRRVKEGNNIEVLGVIIGNVDRRTKLWEEVTQVVKQRLPGRSFSTHVPRAQDIQNLVARGKCLFQVERLKNHPATKAYRSIADEIQQRILNREQFLAQTKLPAPPVEEVVELPARFSERRAKAQAAADEAFPIAANAGEGK